MTVRKWENNRYVSYYYNYNMFYYSVKENYNIFLQNDIEINRVLPSSLIAVCLFADMMKSSADTLLISVSSSYQKASRWDNSDSYKWSLKMLESFNDATEILKADNGETILKVYLTGFNFHIPSNFLQRMSIRSSWKLLTALSSEGTNISNLFACVLTLSMSQETLFGRTEACPATSTRVESLALPGSLLICMACFSIRTCFFLGPSVTVTMTKRDQV